MKKIKLSLIFDLIFIFFAVFCLLFTVFMYFTGKSYFSFFISFLISATLIFLLYFLRREKTEKQSLTKSQSKLMQKTYLSLAFMEDEKTALYLKMVFENLGYKAGANKNKLLLPEKNLTVYFKFSAGEVSPGEFSFALKGADLEKCVLLCNALSLQAKQTAALANIKIIEGERLFSMFERSKKIPELLNTHPEKIKKPLINVDISRKKAKTFLSFGIMLLLFSMIVSYPLYYLITGSLMVLFSLFLKFWGKTPPKPESIIF